MQYKAKGGYERMPEMYQCNAESRPSEKRKKFEFPIPKTDT